LSLSHLAVSLPFLPPGRPAAAENNVDVCPCFFDA